MAKGNPMYGSYGSKSKAGGISTTVYFKTIRAGGTHKQAFDKASKAVGGAGAG